MTISVLMSVHNGQTYLREAVESVLAQTMQSFELLVVDDASTDQSLRLLKGFSDARLKVIPLSQNVGLAAALNAALSEARGEFVARMDADDISMPERLQQQHAAMLANPDVVLLGTAFELIDKHGIKFDQCVMRCGNALLQAELLNGNQFCHPSVMMRADALRRAGGYRDIAGRYAQDYDLWLRLAEMGELMNLPEPLLKYRVHDEQVSIAKASAQRRSAELYQLLARQRRQCGVEDLAAARRQMAARGGEMRLALAVDMLQWANDFEARGQGGEARRLRWRALRAAPFSQPVQRMLGDWVRSRLG